MDATLIFEILQLDFLGWSMLLVVYEELYFSFGYLKIWPDYFKLKFHSFYGIDFVFQKQNYNEPSIKREVFFLAIDCLHISRKIIAPYPLITFGLLVCFFLEQVFVCIFKSVCTVHSLLSNELILCSDLLFRCYKLTCQRPIKMTTWITPSCLSLRP